MLKKILNNIQRCLVLILIFSIFSLVYIKKTMYNITKVNNYKDEIIEDLKNKKNILKIELSYLASSGRLYLFIDKNPNIINNKEIISYTQLKTMSELKKISLSKARNNIYRNRQFANNKQTDITTF